MATASDYIAVILSIGVICIYYLNMINYQLQQPIFDKSDIKVLNHEILSASLHCCTFNDKISRNYYLYLEILWTILMGLLAVHVKLWIWRIFVSTNSSVSVRAAAARRLAASTVAVTVWRSHHSQSSSCAAPPATHYITLLMAAGLTALVGNITDTQKGTLFSHDVVNHVLMIL